MIEGIDYVICPICHQKRLALPYHCSRKHKLGKEDVLKLYPNVQFYPKLYNKPRGFLGKHLSDETKKIISKAHLGISLKQQGHKSDCPCGVCRANRGELKGTKFSETHKRNMSIGQRNYIKNNPLSYHELRVKIGKKGGPASCRAQHQRPNNLEQKLVCIIQKYNLPYKFCGNGNLWIGNHNPDFININGKKEVIEVFGNYWHSKEVIGKSEEVHVKEFINHYLQYGFSCKIIWENEINKLSEQEILNKLLDEPIPLKTFVTLKDFY